MFLSVVHPDIEDEVKPANGANIRTYGRMLEAAVEDKLNDLAFLRRPESNRLLPTPGRAVAPALLR